MKSKPKKGRFLPKLVVMERAERERFGDSSPDKMKPWAKKRWLAALRGKSKLGVYDQGTGSLFVTEEDKKGNLEQRFCCLGVLANECLTIKDVTALDAEASGDMQGYGQIVGITYDVQEFLIEQNDCAGRTFSEIADWVEAKL